MSLRIKALIFVVATFIALLGVLALVADRVVFSSFGHLEAIKIREQADLEEREFRSGIAELAQTCLDYSGWDQAWNAVGASTPAPLQEELADATLINLHLRGACIFNRDGSVFLAKGFDLERGQAASFPTLPDRFLATTGPLLRQPLQGSGTSGLVLVGSEPFIFASQPILPTNRQGVSRGAFVMLRPIDLQGRSTLERHVDGWAGDRPLAADPPDHFMKMAGLRDNRAPRIGEGISLNDSGLGVAFASSESPGEKNQRFSIRLLGEGAIEGTLWLEDLEKKPLLGLRVRTTRRIHDLGTATRRALWLALLISGLVFGSLCLWLLRRYVLERLENFTVTIGKLAEDPQLELALDESGEDEVAKMAGVFNRMREARDLSRHALEDANTELESFNSSVSHDLRAPARHLTGFANILLEDHGKEFPAEVHDLVVRIRNSGTRLVETVEDLLRLSRFGREAPQRIPLDLSEMATKIAAEAMAHASPPPTEIVVAPGLKACGDPAWIRHLLENLISNAVKFTRKTAMPRIEFGSESLDGETVFFLRDNGIGFEPALGERLFRPFTRLHAQTEFPGHGIGLVIAKRVVRRHGGWIKAEGNPGVGTTFRFTLPLEKTVS